MKRFAITFVLLAIIADTAISQVQPVPHVELACIPLQVIAGVTTTSYTGKIGGLWIANEICAAEFTGSRMCRISLKTDVVPPHFTLPAEGAWISGGDFNCREWNDEIDQVGRNGTYLAPGGRLSAQRCSFSLPILCCTK